MSLLCPVLSAFAAFLLGSVVSPWWWLLLSAGLAAGHLYQFGCFLFEDRAR